MPSSRLRTLAAHGALHTVSVTGLNIALSFAITVLLARLLGPDAFGQYSFVYVVVLIASIPLTSGVRTLLMREVAVLSDQKNLARLSGLLRCSAYFWLGYCVSLILLPVLVRQALPGDWFGIPSRLYELAFLLLPAIAAIAILSAIMIGLQRVVLGQAVNLLFRPLILMIALFSVWRVSPVWLTAELAIALHVAAAFLAALLALALMLRTLPKRAAPSRPEFDLPAWVRSIVPLTVNAAIGLIFTYTDIIMLGIFATTESVGQYRVATQGALFVLLVMQALNAFVSPKIALHYARRELGQLDAFLSQYALFALVPAAIVFAVFLVGGKDLLYLVFGMPYVTAWGALVLLSLGQLVNVATGFVGPVLNMTGHERETVVGTTLSALINLVLNLVLIPPFGANGAAMATGASIVFWNIYLCWRAYRVTGLRTSPVWRAAALSRGGD